MIIINEIENTKNLLKMELEVEITSKQMIIRCDNRCRLLSHLLHRAGLDIHCTNQGVFTINFDEHSLNEVLNGFQRIYDNPVWIVEFVEKYLDNEFMMTSTFGKHEVEASE